MKKTTSIRIAAALIIVLLMAVISSCIFVKNNATVAEPTEVTCDDTDAKVTDGELIDNNPAEELTDSLTETLTEAPTDEPTEEEPQTVHLGEMYATFVLPDFPKRIPVYVCEDERNPRHYYARIKVKETDEWSEEKYPVYENERYEPNKPSDPYDRQRDCAPYNSIAPYHSWSHYVLHEYSVVINNEEFHYRNRYYINLYDSPSRRTFQPR